MNYKELCDRIKVKSDFRKTITIQGIAVQIGLATAEQDKLVGSIYSNMEDSNALETFSDLKVKSLSYAIKSIDGEEFPDVIELEDGKTVEKSLFLTDQIITWPTAVQDSLFAAVSDLKKESKKKILSDIQYDWYQDPKLLKDEDEDEDVAEDIAPAYIPSGEPIETETEEIGVKDPGQFE